MNDYKKIFPNLPERISGLGELAYNLWWSWHPAARMLFKSMDRQGWKDSIHNPVRMLREIPREILEAAAGDEEYLNSYDGVVSEFRNKIKPKRCWFTENITEAQCLPIAYFSAEYGLHHSLPFYAGGLGFLAGDHLKECSDLGLPLVAVGFMYPGGYLRQRIRVDGWQEEVGESLDRDAAPIVRVLDERGKQLVVKVPHIDPPIYVGVWKVDVGNIPLYLMDTDIEANDPWNRQILAHLYIGDLEQRLRQEIILGIGGSKVLEELGIKHSVLHLNEGHPAFAILERIRDHVHEGMNFDEAAGYVRNTSVFTTHTPVPAGHDVFPFHLLDKHLGSYYPLLGLSREHFFQLGAHPRSPEAGFNMTAFALRMTGYHNGVSKKHAEVARRMWQPLWPDTKEEDIPIDGITNGVHVPTWVDPKMELLFNKHLGKDWLERHDDPETWKPVDDIPDKELWQVYIWTKIKLIDAIRDQGRKRWAEEKADPLNVLTSGTLLDPLALTIGFARRFATYKRAYLIFEDMERLKRLLTNRWRPVQIIFAGKAHPSDNEGKRILQRIFQLACNPDLGGRVAFVEDYGEQLAQYMVHGVDVWLNNPVPPMEASGTSGMKASINGIPQLSILDGWWIEGFNGKNGWAFEGSGSDKKDAEAVYNILETEIVPLYYRMDEDGIPHGWVKVMKEAIKGTAPQFSARRMVKEYVMKSYRKPLEAAARIKGQ
ncbi:alpha-glucan family phosphorylase [Patescibacteria group bacterium]|nr:alpha-glucan family phosphorylase [Patescibacteria group bacterium]